MRVEGGLLFRGRCLSGLGFQSDGTKRHRILSNLCMNQCRIRCRLTTNTYDRDERNNVYDLFTEEEIVLLAVDTRDAIHEITAQTQGKRFIAIGEKCTCLRNIDREDISFLELFKGGFGAEGCG